MNNIDQSLLFSVKTFTFTSLYHLIEKNDMEVTLLFHVEYGCYRAQEVEFVNVLKETNH